MDVHEVHLQLCFEFRCLTLYISGFDLLVQNARRGRSSLFLEGTLSIVIVSPRLVIIRSSTIIVFGCLLLQVSTSEISQQRFGAVASYSSPITLRCIPFASHLLAAIGKEARELINLS